MNIHDVKKQFPWLKKLPAFKFSETCYDCGAALGEEHDLKCDVPRCTCCGVQRIQCDCGGIETEPERWYGIMYFKERQVCLEHNLFCHDQAADGTPISYEECLQRKDSGEVVRFHVPCDIFAPYASVDLNRATQFMITASNN